MVLTVVFPVHQGSMCDGVHGSSLGFAHHTAWVQAIIAFPEVVSVVFLRPLLYCDGCELSDAFRFIAPEALEPCLRYALALLHYAAGALRF